MAILASSLGGTAGRPGTRRDSGGEPRPRTQLTREVDLRRAQKSQRVDVRDLLEQMAGEEADFKATDFVAPAVPHSAVKVRLAGLVAEYQTRPRDFEGWGVFRVGDDGHAHLQNEATPRLVESYLKLLPKVPLILMAPVKGRSWLAFPCNRSDAQQRLGKWQPYLVNLTERAQAFEMVLAAWDGRQFWYAEIERNADPRHSERLRQGIADEIEPEQLNWPGLTPEMRQTYAALVERIGEFGVRKDERRLQRALQTGGGSLLGFVDHQSHWTVEWQDSGGVRHHSAISKDQLTVLSAGICLDGEDQKFDLESLVGVVEYSDERYDW